MLPLCTLGDNCEFGFIPPQASKYCNKASCNLFAGGGSCHQFVKNSTSVKHNKGQHNKIRKPTEAVRVAPPSSFLGTTLHISASNHQSFELCRYIQPRHK
ncbi:uncharacterized protein RBU33_024996 isoform 2-T2 [Hipposideros larvatus]